MWSLFINALRLAGVFSLGATVQRWFAPGDDAVADDSIGGIVKAFIPLLITAGVVIVIYKFLGKKIRIGK